ATLLGMWLVLAREAWARRNSVYLIAFSIGVLLAASFTEIIPESLELHPQALLIVLGTFFLFYVLEHSVVAHHHHLGSSEFRVQSSELPNASDVRDDHRSVERHVPVEKLAFVGLAVHSLVDGLAIGAGFEVSPALGIIATLAVILHEVPEGIVTLSLFLHADYQRRRAVALTAIVALATPVGAIATAFIPALRGATMLGTLLAVAGGSFLYVAAADLIPETHRAKHIPAILLMLLGIMVPIAVERFL
ncbi:ZIP family metal transporter, partial [Candidatus Uhrbacteria bacterium]|nr:ZIP family metal transporter [Candidatus Uhrbacteria bacterium]